MNTKTNAFAFPRMAGQAVGASLLALVSLVLAPRTAQAQSQSLDNFATGVGKVSASSGVHTVQQTGSGIVGGTRTIILSVGSGTNNPFDQTSVVQVRPSTKETIPSALIWDVGYAAASRIDLEYGNGAPLGLDISSYNLLTVSFNGLAGNLNFNIEAWQPDGESAMAGCNLGPVDYAFNVDLPMTAFTLLNGNEIDWSNISLIDIIFQAGTAADNSNLAITGFSAMTSDNGTTCNAYGS